MTVVGILAVLSVYLGFFAASSGVCRKVGRSERPVIFCRRLCFPNRILRMFLIGNLVVCVLAGIICSDVISRGITSLCRMQANCDSPVSLAFWG